MHPRYLRIEDYTYELPDERIAQHPAAERDQSKLLIYNNGIISEDIYRNIAQHLPPDSLMIFNQTRVVNVRLVFRKDSGARIEVFCLEPDARYPDMQQAMSQKGEVYWKCLVGGAQKWKDNVRLSLSDDAFPYTLHAEMIGRSEGTFLIRLQWSAPDLNFAEVLHDYGKVPLPPYMNRSVDKADEQRYQTVYAREEGSVAAPTAGLHFTPLVFEQLASHNIETAFLTLHVGAGTFMPVKSSSMDGHTMHAEWIEVSLGLLQRLANRDRPVTAVGTTSMRSLESLYWIGLKLYHNMEIDWNGNAVNQWDPYELPADIDTSTALGCVIRWMEAQQLNKLITRTQILIAPGYKPRLTNILATNFHQPNSTLLLLVAALIGDEWKRMYEYALRHDFRFLSYGDGCLIHCRT